MYITGASPHTAADGICADAHDRAHKDASYFNEEGCRLKVVIMSKVNFSVTYLENVTNIAYNSATDVYTVTAGSSTTYSGASYNIQILW